MKKSFKKGFGFFTELVVIRRMKPFLFVFISFVPILSKVVSSRFASHTVCRGVDKVCWN